MKKARLIINRIGGFSTIEAVLAAALFGMIVTGFAGVYLYGEQSIASAGDRARATMLAQEGLEAVRNIRDVSYFNLIDGAHGISDTSGVWTFSGASDTIDQFTRQITIASGGTNRKDVTAQITWPENPVRTGSVSLETELTNWMAQQKWLSPSRTGSYDVTGYNNGEAIQIQGNYAYMVLYGGSPDFVVFDISDPATPKLVGSLTLPNYPVNIFVSGNYAYVASYDNNGELAIVNISDPTNPTLAGVYDAPAGANGEGIYVVGNTAYLTRTSSAYDELSVIDVSDHTNPTLLGSVNLGMSGYDVIVSGNYAYIGTNNSTQNIQVVDVSNPTSPTVVGSISLSGSGTTYALALSGTTLYAGRGSDVFTVDISNPLSPKVLGFVSTLGPVYDIALSLDTTDGTLLFVGTSYSRGDFQVIDVSDPTKPTIFSMADFAIGYVLGVAYDPSSNHAYLATTDNSNELIVVGP